MANELTRKGIAFGAAVALGSTLVVGGAANAAPSVNYQDLELTVADLGNSNGVLATTSENNFGLVLSWNGDVNTTNFDDLEYSWSWADADVDSEDAPWPGAEDGQGYGWFGSTYASYDTYEDQVVADYSEDGCWADYTGWEAPHAGGNFTDTEDEGGVGYTGPVGAWDATEAFGRDEDGALSYWGAPFIQFGTCYTPDEKAVITVQAYVDSNNNNVIDNTETHSAPVEVTFWNPAALAFELVLEDDGVVFDADAEEGTGSIDYDVNITTPLNDNWTSDEDEDLDGDFFVESYRDGEDYDEDTSIDLEWVEDVLTSYGSIDYDVIDGVEDLNSSITRVRAGAYNEATEETVYTEWQTIVAREASVDYVEAFVTEQETVISGYMSEDEDAEIHADVESLEYNIEFWDEDGEDDVTVAGVDATVDVYFYGDEDELADYGLTVGGVEGVETSEDSDVWLFEVEGTSDADGILSFDIEVENPDENLYLDVDYVYYENTEDDIDGDLNWDLTEYYVDFQGSFGDEDNATVAVGGSFDFEAYVTDQWGRALDGAELRVYSEDRNGWDEKDFDVNNGVVELEITDGDATEGEEFDTYYSVELFQDGEDLNLGEDFNYESDGYGYYTDEDFEIDWLTESAEAGYVTADWDGGDGLTNVSYYDFVSGNYELEWRELDAIDAYWDAYYGGDGEWLELQVHGPDGYLQGAQHFTVSGSGLYFFDYDEDVAKSGVGSVSGMTDEDGYGYVWVQGHNVGEHTITVTANGKSTTVDLTVLDENLYGSAVSVAPFTGKAGTAETISATVTDKFGNKVPDAEVSFSAVGGGYFNDATGTTGGDADDSLEDVAVAGYGVATSQLIIQSGEVGYGTTVTATIDVVDPLGVAEDTTASASLAAGATDFGKPAFWTKDLGDGTLKLYAKNIVGAGKIQFFHNGKEIAWIKAVDALDPKLRAANGSYYLVRTVKLVSGKNVLEIKDDGVRVVRRVASK